ncbi:MAG: hypothetical protein ABI443_09830 [Chthoniobacterales bacterium]
MLSFLRHLIVVTMLLLAASYIGTAKAADRSPVSQNSQETRWEKALILPRPKWVINSLEAQRISDTVEGETDSLRLDKMEAQLRIYQQFIKDSERYEQEQHYRLLFTDENYRLLSARDSKDWIDIRKKASPQQSAMILTNRAFLEWQTGEENQNYESLRDEYAMAIFGEKLNNEAFFKKIAANVDYPLSLKPVIDNKGHVTGVRKTDNLRWWQSPATASAYGKVIAAVAQKSQESIKGAPKTPLIAKAPTKTQIQNWQNTIRLARPSGLITDTEGEKLLKQFEPDSEDAPGRLVAWQRYRDAASLYEHDQHFRLLYSDPAYREHILKSNGLWSLIVNEPSPDAAMHIALNRSFLSSISNREPDNLSASAFASYGKQILGMDKIDADALFQKIATDFDTAVRWQLKFDSGGNIVDKQDLNMFRAWDENKLLEAVRRDVINSSQQ